MLATDLADYLVLKGIPFREAHDILGNIVKYSTEEDKKLNELSLEEFKKFNQKHPKASQEEQKSFLLTQKDRNISLEQTRKELVRVREFNNFLINKLISTCRYKLVYLIRKI